MKQVKFKNALRSAALTGGLFLTASAFGQQVVVKGHVKDASGEPVIGATVRVDGTQGVQLPTLMVISLSRLMPSL